ncbi:glycerol kinase GlpK [Paenibacillus sp. LHD-38]|uniref:glycerol kinase GlpK n=1 Tax=Paenibacillus sp. LHD-38 TaxID=3072143 RepID=UPI0035BE5096
MAAMGKYILAIDQSTSGTKALLVDGDGVILGKSSVEHKQYYPEPGWVEHDPIAIYENVKESVLDVLKQTGTAVSELAVLTITNQRETAILWDRITGQPVYNAIVWQCQRTSEACAAYRSEGHEPAVLAKTGLMLDPYFSASKWRWILDHAEGASAKLAEGRLLAGNMDSWLIWKLTGGKVHATDYTNASRTSLFNIHTLEWDEEMCRIFGVPSSLLPEVKYSDEKFGFTEKDSWLGAAIPISGVIGDSQAALFGNLCLEEGMAKATYGTGTSVLMNIGSQPASFGSGLVQTIAWGRENSVTYALEAVIRTSGDSLKWLRENLELFDSFEEMDRLLEQVPSNEGVYLVPAFVGLGAPYWQPNVRAAISGMNRGTGKAHIIRAALESIAYQVFDAVELLQSASGITLEELRADGGAAENTLLMQFQTDILRKKIVRTGVAELSAMGSVFLGGLAAGIWRSTEDLKKRVQSSRTYVPQMKESERAACLDGWRKAVSALLFQDECLSLSKK